MRRRSRQLRAVCAIDVRSGWNRRTHWQLVISVLLLVGILAITLVCPLGLSPIVGYLLAGLIIGSTRSASLPAQRNDAPARRARRRVSPVRHRAPSRCRASGTRAATSSAWGRCRSCCAGWRSARSPLPWATARTTRSSSAARSRCPRPLVRGPDPGRARAAEPPGWADRNRRSHFSGHQRHLHPRFATSIADVGSSSERALALAVASAALKAAIAFLAAALICVETVSSPSASCWSPRYQEIFTAIALLIILAAAAATGGAGGLTLGAFLGGMTISETPYRHVIQTEARPFALCCSAFSSSPSGCRSIGCSSWLTGRRSCCSSPP